MKDKETQANKLDEQVVTAAATAALSDLQLDVEIESVRADSDGWRVQFTAEYGQFRDPLHDSFGKENSPALIRQKVKRHLLKQQQNKIRSGVRIRRGQPEQRRASSNTLVETALETIAGMVNQTAGVTGEVIKQAARLPEQALAAVTGTAETPSTSTRPSRPSSRKKVPALARVTVKATADKPAPQRSSPVRQATAKKSPPTKQAARKSARPATTSSAKSSPSKSAAKKTARKKKR